MPEVPQKPEAPNQPEGQPKKPEVPNQPEEQPKNPEVPSQPEEQPKTPEVPSQPQTPEVKPTPQVTPSESQKGAGTSQVQTPHQEQKLMKPVVNSTSVKHLPATGETTNPFFTAAAVAVMTSAGLLTLSAKRREY